MTPTDPALYRFVGGPWHNERHEMDGRPVWLVALPQPLPTAAWTATGDVTTQTGMKVAVYERQGDYQAEWFYRFKGIEVR